MTWEEAFEATKIEFLGKDITITSVDDAEALHRKLIDLRTELVLGRRLLDMMPHYRGEQNYGWDIRSGIFRPPLKITDAKIGKDLELKAIQEFETVITQKVGPAVLRDLFYKEKHGKDWDLLLQAQHAGIKTTLTDWSAEIVSALYFASEQSPNVSIEGSDGQLWIFLAPTNIIMGHNNIPVRRTFYDMNPFDMNRIVLINPSSYLDNIQDRIFEYRMYKQKGRFIMPANASAHIPINQQEEIKQFIIRVKIPAANKQAIRDQLAERGIVRSVMYIDETPKRQVLITDINRRIFTGY